MPIYADGTKDEIWTSTSKHAKGKLYFGEPKTAYYDEESDVWSFGSTVTFGASHYALLTTADNQAYVSAASLGALTNGAMVAFKMPAANSGAACTLNVNGLGAKNMVRSSDQSTQITTNDLLANGIYFAQYNSTGDCWVVMNTPATSNFADLTTNQTISGNKTFAKASNYALMTTSDNIAYVSATAIAALENGQAILIKMPNAPSGASCTLNVNSKGAKKMFLPGLVATQVSTGDLEANATYIAVYNSTLDSASGGWIIFGAGAVHRTGAQSIGGIKTFTSAQVHAVTLNYVLAVRASESHFTAAVAITALTPGAEIRIKMPAASDATSALAVNGLAEKKMLKASDRTTQIGSADMKSGGVYRLIYDDSVDAAAGAWLVDSL